MHDQEQGLNMFQAKMVPVVFVYAAGYCWFRV